jgi:hypothetical protein
VSLCKSASCSLATFDLGLLPYALSRCQQPEGQRGRECCSKNAVIYGDGEKVGGAVACEGARVFLTGRTLESLDEVSEEIASSRTSNDGRDKQRRTYELEARIQRLLHRRHTDSKRVLRLGS